MSGIVSNNTSEGSGQIAAVQGITTSSSDPAVDTNPSGGIGTMFVNTISCEMYVCTDSTAGSNVWKNVGEGTGTIEPWIYGGLLNGFHAGGYHTGSGSNMISSYSFTSDGDAVDTTGNLTVTTGWPSATSNGDHTYGYRIGGWSGLDSIDRYQFGAGADAVDVGDCLTGGNHGTGNSSSTYAYTIGGSPSVVQKLSYASATGNMAEVGTGGRGHGAYTGYSSTTDGYAAGGADGISQVDKWSFSSDADSEDVGDMVNPGYGAGGHSSAINGYRTGGYSTPTYYNVIEKMPFATDTHADTTANLSRSPDTAASNSSTTNGYSCGGHAGGYTNVIDKFSFTSDSDADDIGNLVESKSGLNGCGQ